MLNASIDNKDYSVERQVPCSIFDCSSSKLLDTGLRSSHIGIRCLLITSRYLETGTITLPAKTSI